MDNPIQLNESFIRQVFKHESNRIVGTCLKRFEIHTNPEEQKKAIKEVLYENLRNLMDIIILNGRESMVIEIQKSKELQNGR